MIEIMGMIFKEDKVPDFGSIRMITANNTIKKEVREYILKQDDLNKLSLLENADSGSRALCIDTSKVYIKFDDEWIML